MNVKQRLQVEWINKRSRGKVWLRGQLFQNADQTEVQFWLQQAKQIYPRSEPFIRYMEPKLWEISSPGYPNHPRFLRCQQWELVLFKSGNVNQKKDVILAQKTLLWVIIYGACFEQEEAWYLLTDDNTPEAMRGNSSGSVGRSSWNSFILSLMC